MQTVKDEKTVSRMKLVSKGHKVRLVCAGVIRKPGFPPRLCQKVLCEPNRKGELAVKIICPRCGFVNEV